MKADPETNGTEPKETAEYPVLESSEDGFYSNFSYQGFEGRVECISGRSSDGFENPTLTYCVWLPGQRISNVSVKETIDDYEQSEYDYPAPPPAARAVMKQVDRWMEEDNGEL